MTAGREAEKRMATQIISQAIIRRPEDPSVQLSIVRAEIDKQNAIRNAQRWS